MTVEPQASHSLGVSQRSHTAGIQDSLCTQSILKTALTSREQRGALLGTNFPLVIRKPLIINLCMLTEYIPYDIQAHN